MKIAIRRPMSRRRYIAALSHGILNFGRCIASHVRQRSSSTVKGGQNHRVNEASARDR
jgi:hypothetical protein